MARLSFFPPGLGGGHSDDSPWKQTKGFMLTYSHVLTLVGLFILASLLSPYFLQSRNLFNVLRGASIIGLVAIGMTFVIINKGIDLSVGAMVGVSSTAAAYLVPHSIPLAIVVSLGLPTLLGLANGLLITRLNIQPFIVTLSTMIFIRGAIFLKTDGSNVILRGGSESFRWIGSGHIGPVPTPVVIFLVAWVLALVMLRHTRFGRHVYAVGANEHASRLYGIPVDWLKIRVYIASGFLCGVAGLILTSRLSVAEPNAGELYELEAIAATLIGGTTFDGGVGGVGGTILGVLILALLGNILNLLDVSPYYQMLLQGVIIILAVVVSEARQRKR